MAVRHASEWFTQSPSSRPLPFCRHTEHCRVARVVTHKRARGGRSRLWLPRVKAIGVCAAASAGPFEAEDEVVEGEYIAAVQEGLDDGYVPYKNRDGMVDLASQRCLFLLEQPDVSSTLGLSSDTMAALGSRISPGTIGEQVLTQASVRMLNMVLPQLLDADQQLWCGLGLTTTIEVLAKELAGLDKQVLLSAPHRLGLAEHMHAAGIQVVAEGTSDSPGCTLQQIEERVASVKRVGSPTVAVCVVTLDVEDSELSSTEALESVMLMAAREKVHLIVDVGAVVNHFGREGDQSSILSTCLQLQRGEHGRLLHVACNGGFGEHDVPMSMLISRHNLVSSELGSPVALNMEAAVADEDISKIREQMSIMTCESVQRQRDTIFELKQLLDTSGVPAKRQGTQHVWIDLSQFLDIADVESEVMMWRVLHETYKVLLLPGHMCGVPALGWFRMCVTGSDEDTLIAGLNRLESFLRAQKMLHGRW